MAVQYMKGQGTMKMSRTFWSITGALGVMSVGAGIGVAQPIFSTNAPVNLHEGVSLPGPSPVKRVAGSVKVDQSPAQVEMGAPQPAGPASAPQPDRSSVSAAPKASAKSVVSPVSRNSAVSPASAKSAVSPVSAKSAVSPISAASAVSAWSPQSPPSGDSAPSADSAD